MPLLRQWFESQWGEIDAFQADGMPDPLVAISGQTLTGGLVFTIAPGPDGPAACVWVNALYVAPEFRGLGIARQLVLAAAEAAARQHIAELFVLSDVPALYVRCGWTQVSDASASGECVLHLQLDK